MTRHAERARELLFSFNESTYERRVAAITRAFEEVEREAREDERHQCIAYADRTERMHLARAQRIADDADRADSEASADDEERHEMRAEGARSVAHGLRRAAHRPVHPSNLTTVLDVLETDVEQLRAENAKLRAVADVARKRCKDAVPDWAPELRAALSALDEGGRG